MAQNGRPPIRTFSPYAVDSVEGQSKEPKSLAGSYRNGAYSNLGLVQSQENISRNPVSTFKAGHFPNPVYENPEVNTHTYDDPAYLTPVDSTKPRRKRNELYEPTLIRTPDREAEKDNVTEEISGDSWLSRLVLFLILLISLTSLLLVVLIIQGQIGRSCSQCDSEEPVPQRGALASDSDTTEPPAVFVAPPTPPDVSPLENLINELRRNISSIKTYMEKLQQDIQSTKGDLKNTNTNISDTKQQVSAIESRANSSITEIKNISQQLDASVSAINVSFFEELSSVRTSFDSKLNYTTQNLLDADNSLQTLLNAINSSLSAQVQSIDKLQGPQGPPGFNGSKGDTGAQGLKGSKGMAGATGDKGDRGPKGNAGVNGANGIDGQNGATGIKGAKGDPGTTGPAGPKGTLGLQGAQGAGNFSQCSYQNQPGTGVTQGGVAVAINTLVENAGEKILGVTCSTNYAAEYNLSVQKGPSGHPHEGKNIFTCKCQGQSDYFKGSGQTFCYIHYWKCPLTT